ncbi:MAG TPA: hypothetical protein VKY73_08805 [Polyangiaceae bacterium]|nr:hypothetical protein [Polyangiaceae bacterium]
MPAPPAAAPGNPRVGVAQWLGIQVSAEPGAWKGAYAVPLELTPILITLTNGSSHPIRVRHEDFVLAGHEHTLRAQSPETIEPREVRASLGLEPGSPINPPPLPASSPRSAGETPNPGEAPPPPSAAPGPGFREPSLHPAYSTREAIRTEVREAALPEGVLPAGHQVRGFVYFDRLPSDARSVELQIAVRQREQGAPLTVLRVPFRVER